MSCGHSRDNVAAESLPGVAGREGAGPVSSAGAEGMSRGVYIGTNLGWPSKVGAACVQGSTRRRRELPSGGASGREGGAAGAYWNNILVAVGSEKPAIPKRAPL